MCAAPEAVKADEAKLKRRIRDACERIRALYYPRWDRNWEWRLWVVRDLNCAGGACCLAGGSARNRFDKPSPATTIAVEGDSP